MNFSNCIFVNYHNYSFFPFFSFRESIQLLKRYKQRKKAHLRNQIKRVCISFLSIKYFSLKSFFKYIFISNSSFKKNKSREIFKTLNKERNETPKEVALVVNRQLSENIKQIYSKSKNNNINYLLLCCSQPYFIAAR